MAYSLQVIVVVWVQTLGVSSDYDDRIDVEIMEDRETVFLRMQSDVLVVLLSLVP